MKKFILLIFLSFLAGTMVKAQLYLKNNTPEPVNVASVVYINEKGSESWFSKGWVLINPGEKKVISSFVGDKPIVYFYAKSTISEIEYTGDTQFLVSNDSFQIQNADMDYVKEQNPKYYWKKFRKEHAYLKSKTTIVLNY